PSAPRTDQILHSIHRPIHRLLFPSSPLPHALIKFYKVSTGQSTGSCSSSSPPPRPWHKSLAAHWDVRVRCYAVAMNGDLEQLGESIAEQAAHLDAAMHRLLADLRAFDQRGGWHVQGALSCAHWLSWRVGWELVTARERVRVANKLAEFPAIDDALRR